MIKKKIRKTKIGRENLDGSWKRIATYIERWGWVKYQPKIAT